MSSQPGNESLFSSLSDAMANAVEKAGPAILLVNARRRFPATGIGYGKDLVLTANHVVERDDEIQVFLPDGTQVDATLAGRDPGVDLALLRLSQPSANVAEVALSAGRVGQLVLAVGRPSTDGLQASLGVIVATGSGLRTHHGGMLDHYLVTDAIPYPGFSGGPLIDAAGRVLGINTSGLAHGSALTIPANLAWEIASSLAQHGHVRRGYLGIRSQPVELPNQARQVLQRDQISGLLLVGIEPGSPAETAGLMVGDIIVGLNGQQISDHDELFARLNSSLVSQPAEIEILRGGQVVKQPITIGERK